VKLALSNDYELCFAEDRASAVEAFETTSPAMTLVDLDLPPRASECEEGMTALCDLLAIDRTAKVIVISGRGEK
jgi:ActR/RegA family two-component response regulator